MSEKFKEALLAIIFIIVFFVVAFGILSTVQKLRLENFNEACNEIGFDKYYSMNNEDYCSNNGIDLFRVNMELKYTKKIFNSEYKAIQVNLYNYGEDND
jgi:hypothetical protein